MSAKKDKLLESAQKSLKKKQIPKAIKDYVKVVELDPSDMRSRQKLAELYVRVGKNAEAYEQFEAVAKYFAGNGFYLKAIAIYKQMQRLDPSQISLYSRLAELNEKQGLIGNAMAEYRNLSSHYESNGMVADAISTLEKMRDLDTSNLNVRVKLAEVYANNDRKDDGLVEFEGVLGILSDRREYDKILKLYKMFLPLFPENKKLQTGLALTLYEKGELEKGITILTTLLQDDPNNAELLRLLARGYKDLEDWEKARDIYSRLLELVPSDLDYREALIDCLIESEEYELALDELEEWKDNFLQGKRLQSLQQFYELLQEKLPKNKKITQTLDSIYELTGDSDKLLDIVSDHKSASAEEESDETLSDSLLGSADEDIDVPTIDLGFEETTSVESDDSAEAENEGFAVDLPVEENDFDLELEPLEDSSTAGEPEEEIIELNLTENAELEPLDEEDVEFSFDMEDVEAATEPQEESPRNVQSDLEEAEFYIQQGLYAEAETLCRDILAYAPDSVACQQKLEEIRPHLEEQRTQGAEDEESPSDALKDDFALDLDEFDFSADSPEQGASEGKKVFRTNVDEQIAADDLESHYNLGIAYREMGLLDDAISEFEKAERDPARFVDCQTLKGLCYADKGDFANAENMFLRALDSEHLEDSQRLNLGYELGSLHERCERFKEALESFQDVCSQDEGYRDVKQKVHSLQQRLGVEPEETSTPDDDGKERISFI